MKENNTNSSPECSDSNYTYDTAWICELESEDHWRLYWMQQKLIRPYLNENDHLFEVGIGTGFTSNYLRSKGYNVTTLDIDADKNPDIVGNIVNYEFPRCYEHILGFEVFEHIPYDKFLQILPKLRKSCTKTFGLSVPFGVRIIGKISLKLPKLPEFRYELKRAREKIFSPHHKWELSIENQNREKLIRDLADNGFEVVSSHEYIRRFFVLCK